MGNKNGLVINKRFAKKNMESVKQISERLKYMVMDFQGVEFKEIKKEIYRLELKLTSQKCPNRNANNIDREINKMLDELTLYINSKSYNVIINYINRISLFIQKRTWSEKGDIDVKELGFIEKILTRKKRNSQQDVSDREIFDLRNKMFAEFDKIDQYAAERKSIIETAKKLSPGDPRELGYAQDIEECDRKSRSSITTAKIIADSLSIKTAFKDMDEHNNLIKALAKAQTSSDDLEKLAGQISIYKESLKENAKRSGEILRAMDEEIYDTGISKGSGLAAINEARALDENLMDLELVTASEESGEIGSVNKIQEPELR